MVLHEQAEPDFVREHDIDHVTLDIIENALKNIRHEMDRVLVTTAVSPVIREQADEFPLIADRKGRMVVGQFGSPVDTVLENSPYAVEDLKDGDVIALNDPYMMEGSTSHLPDILLVRPIFYEDDHIGYALQWGNLMDVGGSTAGSIPIDARSIYEEGVRLPPVKLYDGGTLNEEVLRFFCHNSRTPRETRADVMAIAAGTAAGAQRVKDICDRFGKDTYLEACDALLARTRTSIINLIRQLIPEGERFEFEDYTDDDGLGNGPIKLKLAMWREGDSLHLDWTGTDAQVPGPVNFLLNKEMFQMFAGVFLISAVDPTILFNDGYADIIKVNIPDGTVLRPKEPAPLSNRLVVVDITLGFTDPESPLACDLEGPISEIQKLLRAARRAEIPIAFTTLAYRESDKLTAAAFIDKVPALLTLQAGTRWAEIDPRIAPEETEPVLNKLFASGFFGTGLSSLLTAAGIDTLIITGASTSGCVRATAVDALQYGFRPVVPREAVGDRNPDAHEANLYDIDAKYGDVVPVQEVLDLLGDDAAAHAR